MTVDFPYQGGSKSVVYNLDCNGKLSFSMSPNETWLTTGVTISNGRGRIDITVDENENGGERSVDIIPLLNGVGCSHVTIRQAGNGSCSEYVYNGTTLKYTFNGVTKELGIEDEILVGECGGTYYFNVNGKYKCANPPDEQFQDYSPKVVWTRDESQNWFRISSSNGGASATLTVDKNCDEVSDSSSVSCKIYDIDGVSIVKVYNFEIIREGVVCDTCACEEEDYNYYVDVNFNDEVYFNECGNTIEFKVNGKRRCRDKAEENWPVEVVWNNITPLPNGFTINGGDVFPITANSITITADENCEDTQKRLNLSYTVTSSGFRDTYFVVLLQDGQCETCGCMNYVYNAEISPSDIEFGECGGSTGITLSATRSCEGTEEWTSTTIKSVEWYISENDYVSLTNTGLTTATVVAREKDVAGVVNVTISAVTTHEGNATATTIPIHVTMSEGICNPCECSILNVITTSLDFNWTGGETLITYYLSNSDCTIEVQKPEWVSVGFNEDNIAISVAENQGEERNGLIEFIIGGVVCEENKISVNQSGFECTEYIVDSNDSLDCNGGTARFFIRV